MDLLEFMEAESKRLDYRSLALCMGFHDGHEDLIHHIDADRRERYDRAVQAGAVAVGVFWILHDRQFGYVAGCQEFNGDPVWARVFNRELKIMRDLLAKDPAFRDVLSETVPRIH